jgi:hypothetical protein
MFRRAKASRISILYNVTGIGIGCAFIFLIGRGWETIYFVCHRSGSNFMFACQLAASKLPFTIFLSDFTVGYQKRK